MISIIHSQKNEGKIKRSESCRIPDSDLLILPKNITLLDHITFEIALFVIFFT